uniref:DUF223 domain-containing protein n=1 Tax=Brassica oleracea var. oleracea TaxID=109376 RepID=A0A0D3ARP7_BRAOL
MSFSASPVLQTSVSGIRHSTFESFHLGRSNSVIHGFISAGHANHYMSFLKVDRFEVTRCSSMYKITDHQFFIRLISPTIIDKVITSAHEINLPL